MKRNKIFFAFALIAFIHYSCVKEPGPVGPEGKQGQTGEKGEPGEKGIDGTNILSGHTEPSDVLGKPGDFYLYLTNSLLFGPKTDSGWGEPISLKGQDGKNGNDGRNGSDGQNGKDGQDGKNGQDGKDGKNGQDGDKGKDGASFLSGENPPNNNIGKAGDFYFSKIERIPPTNYMFDCSIICL